MFDFNKTLELVKGGLTEPRRTWQDYLATTRPWMETAALLTGPLIVAALVISWLIAAVFGTYFVYGYGYGLIVGLIVGLVFAAINVFVVSFLLSFFAGTFDGQKNFDRAFAAVSLAMIPAWTSMAVGTIPLIGSILQLVGGITSLVFLYMIIPLALSVPEEKRAVHFIVTIVAVIVASVIIGGILSIGAVSGAGVAAM